MSDMHLRYYLHGKNCACIALKVNGLDYSLQGNRKTLEGSAHPGRNTQFEYINASVKQFQQRGQTVISVDTKKKEFVGAFKNGGREWQPKGEPEKVKVHDTARFAAEAIARWWKKMESKLYGDAKELLITADGGGSNGSRCRLWKVALQELATKLEMPVYVRHFPPGTSK